jgi:hypothetical protein
VIVTAPERPLILVSCSCGKLGVGEQDARKVVNGVDRI